MSGVGRGQNQDKVLTWWEQRLSPREKLKLVDTGRDLHSSFGKKTCLETELEFWQFRWSAQCTQDVLLFLSLCAILLPTCPFRDSGCLILVCDSFNLTRTIPETTGLGLTMEPDEATSGCQLTPPLSDSISKKQFCSKGQGTLSPSSTMSVCGQAHSCVDPVQTFRVGESSWLLWLCIALKDVKSPFKSPRPSFWPTIFYTKGKERCWIFFHFWIAH